MSGGQDCNLWILREHSSANTANKRKPVKQVMAHLDNRINAIEPLKNKAAPKSWNSMSWNHPQDIYSGCCCLVASHVWLFCDPINCSLPGSSIHGILQARILEWVAIPFSRGSSWTGSPVLQENMPNCKFKQVILLVFFLFSLGNIQAPSSPDLCFKFVVTPSNSDLSISHARGSLPRLLDKFSKLFSSL